jgi:hypothetical protein
MRQKKIKKIPLAGDLPAAEIFALDVLRGIDY